MADGLTAEHRARIVAVLAPEGKVMTPEAWAELEGYVVCFRIWETRRTTYPIVEERKRWKRLGDAVKTVGAELCELHCETLWTNPDPTWRRALATLWEVHRRVETRVALHAIWGKPFSGRQNPYREFLYGGVMRIWTDRLGGVLRSSNSPEGPSGPLVRFLEACVEPILGKQTPRAGIADIINRECESRAKTQDEKRRRRARMGF